MKFVPIDEEVQAQDESKSTLRFRPIEEEDSSIHSLNQTSLAERERQKAALRADPNFKPERAPVLNFLSNLDLEPLTGPGIVNQPVRVLNKLNALAGGSPTYFPEYKGISAKGLLTQPLEMIDELEMKIPQDLRILPAGIPVPENFRPGLSAPNSPVRAVAESLENFVTGLSDPQTLVTLPAFGGTGTMGNIARALFFGDMARHTPELSAEKGEIITSPDATFAERVGAGTDVALNDLMLAGIGHQRPKTRVEIPGGELNPLGQTIESPVMDTSKINSAAFEESKLRLADLPELLGEKQIIEQTPYFNDLRFGEKRSVTPPILGQEPPLLVELNENMKSLVEAIKAQKEPKRDIVPANQALGVERTIERGATGVSPTFEGGLKVQPGVLKSASDRLLERPEPDFKRETLSEEPPIQVTGPSGPYRRPTLPPTLEQIKRRQERENVEAGLTLPSGEVYDIPTSPKIEAANPKNEGVVLSKLQRARLRKAIARGASDEVIHNILRQPKGQTVFTVNDPNTGMRKPKLVQGQKFYSGLAGEVSDWIETTAARLLKVPEKLRYAPNRQGEYDGGQLVNRLMNEIPPAERAYLERPLKEAFKPGQKVTAEQVLKVVEENSPKVEVKKLSADEASLITTAEQQRLAELQHWRDTLPEPRRTEARAFETGGLNEAWLREHRWNENDILRLREIDQFNDVLSSRPRGNESATARFQMVNPKPLDQMPGAVDILVRVPVKETGRTPKGAVMNRTGDIKFVSSHYPTEGENLVVHVRANKETLPDGRTVIHAFEVQSDWGQALREKIAKRERARGVVPDSMMEHDEQRIRKMSDPLLRHYEQLAVKALIDHARKEKADAIAISDAETAMLSEGHDRFRTQPESNPIPYNENMAREMVRDGMIDEDQLVDARQRGQFDFSTSLTSEDRYYVDLAKKYGIDWPGNQEPPQAKGMRLHYDQILPKIAEELTGNKGERVEFGEHQNAFEGGQDAWEAGVPDNVRTEMRKNPRQDLIFRNPDGTPKTSISARMYSLEKTQADKPFTYFGKDRAGKLYSGFGGELLEATKDFAKTVINTTVQPMIDRLQKSGGPAAANASEKFGQITSRQKKLYGSLTSSLDPAKKEFSKPTPITTWMQSIPSANRPTKYTAVNNLRAVTDGLIPLPEKYKKHFDLFDRVNKQIAALVPGFTGVGRMQQIRTNLGIELIRRGGGNGWLRWTEGLAAHPLNQAALQRYITDKNLPAGTTPLQAVRHMFTEIKKEWDKPMVDTATQDRISQDFHRYLPGVISHVKIMGQWQEVVESKPFNYLEAAADRTSHAVAFREVFPVDSGELGKLRTKVAMEGAKTGDSSVGTTFDEVVRTLQGHPLDAYFGRFSAPDTLPGAAARFVGQTVGVPTRKLMLSANAITNLAESMVGGPLMYGGLRRSLKAMGKIAMNYDHVRNTLERDGMVNRLMYNWSIDPTSPLQSAVRMFSNSVSKVTAQNFLNELQEMHSAMTAKVYLDEVRAGKMSKGAQQGAINFARQLGFSKEQAIRAVVNKEEGLLQQLETRSAARLSAGYQGMGEKSRLGASRAFNSVMWFPSYWMMTANQLRRGVEVVAEDWKAGDFRQLSKSSLQLGKIIGGRALQGTIATAILALAREGESGVKTRAQEAKDEWANFILDATLASMGGPAATMKRLSETGGSNWVGQTLAAFSAPISLAEESGRAAFGKGRYSGADWLERAKMLLESKTPITKTFRMALALTGLIDYDLELQTAQNAFYRWRRSELGEVSGGGDATALSREVKKVKEDLVNGRDWRARLSELVEKGERSYAGRSLGLRTLLKNEKGGALTEEQLKSLKKRIGEKNVELLITRDAMVRELADYTRQGLDPRTMPQPTGTLAKYRETESTRKNRVLEAMSEEVQQWVKENGVSVAGYEPKVGRGKNKRELSLAEAGKLEEFVIQEYSQVLEDLASRDWKGKTQEVKKRIASNLLERARNRAQGRYRSAIGSEAKKVGSALEVD